MWETQELEIDYFNQLQVCEKAPIQEAREGRYHVQEIQWVGVKKADGTHRPTLVAKEIRAYNARELFVA